MSGAPGVVLDGAPVLLFEPVVDLSDGRVLGMDARVEWDHPRRGRIPTDVLVPEIEAGGAGAALMAWLLEESCAQATAWSRSIQLGVGCPSGPLRAGEVAKAVAAVLERSGLDGDQLTLEVAEEVVSDGSATKDLVALRELGVQLGIRDVDMGWSAFDPLRKLAVGTVKIHRAYVEGIDADLGMNQLVVEAVIRAAQSLGMATIADGVDGGRQLAAVKAMGADAAQGRFFSGPMGPEAARSLAGAGTVPRFSRTEPRTVIPVEARPGSSTPPDAAGPGEGAGEPASGADDGKAPPSTDGEALPPADREPAADGAGEPAAATSGGTSKDTTSKKGTGAARRTSTKRSAGSASEEG